MNGHMNEHISEFESYSRRLWIQLTPHGTLGDGSGPRYRDPSSTTGDHVVIFPRSGCAGESRCDLLGHGFYSGTPEVVTVGKVKGVWSFRLWNY